MISTNKKKLPKNVIIAISIMLMLAVATLSYVYVFNGNLFGWSSPKTSPTNLNKPSDEQVKSGSAIKKDSVQGDTTKSNGSTDKPPSPVSQTGEDKQTVEVIITAANQNGDLLQIRAQISAVVGTGQCTLNLSKNGQTITKTADVQALASYSTCKGFDVPASELSAGSWNLTLTYENDTLTGTATKVVPIQ